MHQRVDSQPQRLDSLAESEGGDRQIGLRIPGPGPAANREQGFAEVTAEHLGQSFVRWQPNR
jgi:hypothetical protein